MKTSAFDMQRLKAIELEMLKQFLGVCEKLGLNYYVLGGTLLGAVRHKGFIPWDDDIDIGMPRKDYERFVSEGQQWLPEPYFIQTFQTDPGYPANFAKIRNNNTTFIETSVRNCDMNHGVYIDIFPLDYYPKKGLWRFELQRVLLSFRISTAFTKRRERLKVHLVRWVSCIIYPSHKAALRRRENLFRSVNNGDRIANHCGAWGKKEIVPKQWYAEGCELEFEGLHVKGPKEYDKWLTHVYGDYMQLPPVEKRKGHHYADVIDLERPYTKYRNKG